MAKFKAFWNYQKKKTGEIVIAEEELQEMLDAAWGAGYNQGRAETASPRIIPQNIPQNIPPVPTSIGSEPSDIPGANPWTRGYSISFLWPRTKTSVNFI